MQPQKSPAPRASIARLKLIIGETYSFELIYLVNIIALNSKLKMSNCIKTFHMVSQVKIVNNLLVNLSCKICL